MRAVPADQERFAEAIEAYVGKLPVTVVKPHFVRAHLIGSTELTVPLETTQFRLNPSIRVNIAGPRASVITPVDVLVSSEPSLDRHAAHYKVQAIAAIVSMIFDRTFVAPRDYYNIGNEALSEDQVSELACQYNYVFAGPGALHSQLSTTRQAELGAMLANLTAQIDELDKLTSTKILQAIRLHQLALSIRRSDFDLSFALIVASVEAMAQIAIDREVAKAEVYYTAVELQIKEFCEQQGGEVGGWFKQKVRDQAVLKRRFTRYISTFAPISTWGETRHRFADMVEYLTDVMPDGDWSHLTRGTPLEIRPEHLTDEDVKNVIGRMYDDRSSVFHAGASTSHRYPGTGGETFFEYVEHVDIDREKIDQFVVANFETLSTISRIALLGYLRSRTT